MNAGRAGWQIEAARDKDLPAARAQNSLQRSGLAEVPDLHHGRDNEHNRARTDRDRQRDVPVRDAQVRSIAMHFPGEHGGQDRHEQAKRKRDQGQDEGHQQDSDGDGVPARFPALNRLRHNYLAYTLTRRACERQRRGPQAGALQ